MLYQVIGADFQLEFDEHFVEMIKKHASNFPLADISRLLNILLAKVQSQQAVVIDQLPLELACIEFLLATADIASPEPTVTTTAQTLAIDNKDYVSLQKQWTELVSALKPLNSSLAGIIQSAHPLDIQTEVITVGLEYPFHIEQLDKPGVAEEINKNLTNILGRSIKTVLKIDEDFKTNQQKFKGSQEEEVGDAVDTFGGEVL